MRTQRYKVMAGALAAAVFCAARPVWAGVSRGRYYEEPISACRKQVEASPWTASLRYDLGCLYALQGDFGAAEQELRRALEMDPRHVPAYDALGQVYEQQGWVERAASFYSVSAELEPGNTRVLRHLSRAYLELDNPLAAREALRQMALIAPEDLQALYQLGVLELRSGALEDAAARFQKLVEEAPGHRPAWNGLGLAQARMKKFRQAADSLEEARRLDPDHPATQNNLGLLAAYQNRWEEARSAWEHALELEPGFETAQKNLQAYGRILKQGESR